MKGFFILALTIGGISFLVAIIALIVGDFYRCYFAAACDYGYISAIKANFYFYSLICLLVGLISAAAVRMTDGRR